MAATQKKKKIRKIIKAPPQSALNWFMLCSLLLSSAVSPLLFSSSISLTLSFCLSLSRSLSWLSTLTMMPAETETAKAAAWQRSSRAKFADLLSRTSHSSLGFLFCTPHSPLPVSRFFRFFYPSIQLQWPL